MPVTPARVEERSLIIKPGEREKALQFITKWLEKHARNYLKICDPFFGRTELKLIQLIRSIDKALRVEILTSKSYVDQERGEQSVADYFKDWWRMQISYADAGDVTVVVVGTKRSGTCPIHDRWWLSNGAGLRVGTSFGSLGVTKLSEISVLDMEVAAGLELDADRYLLRAVHDLGGERLTYDIFTLD
jgi:hypothetical protein